MEVFSDASALAAMLAAATLPVASSIVVWQFKRLIKSVELLNIRVAELITQLKYHDDRISSLERVKKD